MKTIKLNTGKNQYKILVGAGLLSRAGSLLNEAGLTAGKAVIITDTKINILHGSTLKNSLEDRGFQVKLIEIPQGEEQKSLETAAMLYNRLTDFYAERSTPLLALGGGVIGDLTGFVAATYMRGMPLVQIPTTLLAQGDSSIGGKTAVNHGQVKNKIGVFYHPRLTISDISLLKTLTPKEISNGLSEIIKHGVILDAGLFRYLKKNMEKIRRLDEETLEYMIARSAAIKAGVVEKDELDTGMRNILNFGHTIGHAIESVSGLKVWHGEAVAIGLYIESKISKELGILSSREVGSIKDLLISAGLPYELPELSPVKILDAMKHDKKVIGGKIRFALPSKIGESFLTDEVSTTIIEKALVS